MRNIPLSTWLSGSVYRDTSGGRGREGTANSILLCGPIAERFCDVAFAENFTASATSQNLCEMGLLARVHATCIGGGFKKRTFLYIMAKAEPDSDSWESIIGSPFANFGHGIATKN